MHFLFNIFQNGQNVVFLPKPNPQHWAYTLRKPQIRVGIQQYERGRRAQRASSP
ncbi:Unknown protein sequence [Pseudomonas syringae pv. maculicola]|nr:Unknown protein sequence [Pseudomonas syringae pv. maculicola]